MVREQVIGQLEDLKSNSKSNIEQGGYTDIWVKDIIALDIAIRCVRKDRRSKEEFWKGYGIGFLVFLGFYILYHIGG